ncbi:MAG TPA: tetratricopeptide repeat protein, partial [Elusimicrobiales bacterium]|nr:tetratricopeptide repeat protein [Elusimicrobiales bacterium]
FSKLGNWDSALSYYQKVVKNNPTFIMPYYFMGNVFTDRFNMTKLNRTDWGDKEGELRDDFERAKDMYEHVRKLAPNYVQMHHQVGVLYMKMADYMRANGKLEEALKYLDKAMNRFEIYQNLDPVFPYNYFRRAQIWVYKGQFKKAEEEYLNYLTGWKCDKHDFAAAQKVYGVDHEGNGIKEPLTWKDIYPNLPEVYTNLGNIYFMMGEYKKSYESYKKALDKNPDYEPAKKNIAAAKLRGNIK